MSANTHTHGFDVFISYSHGDREWVRDWLVPRMRGAGLSICIDYEHFEPGAPVIEKMEWAVENSRKTLLVLTPRWVDSDWSNFESLLLQTGDPLARRRRMVPLMLESCVPRRGISLLTYLDFTDFARREDEFERLVGAVKDVSSFDGQIEMAGLVASSDTPFILPQLDELTFSGREEELRLLEDLLIRKKGAKMCSIAGLAGAGGIGKSALAVHFAELHRGAFPDGVIGLRVDGKDVNALAREFARYYGRVIQPDDERDATAIMQSIFASRRMLLIFDNAEDACVATLRPGGNTCAVIVTTRDRQLPSLLGIPEEGRLDLSPLLPREALDLLGQLLGAEHVAAEPDAAAEVIDLIGRLPLALQIVGA
jgi:hypothetical protein